MSSDVLSAHATGGWYIAASKKQALILLQSAGMGLVLRERRHSSPTTASFFFDGYTLIGRVGHFGHSANSRILCTGTVRVVGLKKRTLEKVYICQTESKVVNNLPMHPFIPDLS